MKKINTHLKYGGITGFVMVVLSLLVYIIDKKVDSPLGMLVYVPLVIGIIMNAMAFSKANDHFVTFGSVFASCFKASAIVAIIMVAWTVLSVQIFPEMKEAGMEIAYKKMSDQGLPDEEIDKWMGMTEKYYTTFAIGGVMFGMMLWGAIVSLLGAAIAKKKGTGFPQ